MTIRTTTPTPTPTGPRLHSIHNSGRHFGAMHVLAPDEDHGRSSAMARRLDQAAQLTPRSHKGAPPPRSAAVHTGLYDGAELAPYTGRPGAMTACDLPSRVGKWLHYRDGRVQAVGA